MTTLKQLQATATTMRELYGLQGTKDLIIALTETVTCPEGECDGSGEVTKWFYDSSVRASISDGTEKCVCQLEN